MKNVAVALFAAGMATLGLGRIHRLDDLSVLSSQETSKIIGGGLYSCNNTRCFDIETCRYNAQGGYWYKGAASTASKKGCGLEIGDCPEVGNTVNCETLNFSDSGCSVPLGTSIDRRSQTVCN